MEVNTRADDDVMTTKHGADTEWMQQNGECLKSLSEGDTVHVIDEHHASTSINTEYVVTDVPAMKYDFEVATVRIVEEGTYGPCIPIAPGKISKDAQR